MMGNKVITLPTGLSRVIRRHNPLHRVQKISLEGTVGAGDFYEKELPESDSFIDTLTRRNYLYLELRAPSNVAQAEYYSPMPMDLSLPLVREFYEMLKQGNTARFNGRLTLTIDWELLPPRKSVSGELKGEFTIRDKVYSVRFSVPPILYPNLSSIVYKPETIFL